MLYIFFTESLKKELPSIDIIPVDLSDWKKTKEAIKNALPIDLLVNNAGLAVLGPLTEVKEEDVDRYDFSQYSVYHHKVSSFNLEKWLKKNNKKL